MNTCKKCGGILKDGDIFCGTCGTKTEPIAIDYRATPDTGKNSPKPEQRMNHAASYTDIPSTTYASDEEQTVPITDIRPKNLDTNSFFCPKCGAPAKNNNTFCGACGHPMNPSAAPALNYNHRTKTTTGSPSIKNKKPFIIAISVIIIISAFIASYFITEKFSSDNNDEIVTKEATENSENELLYQDEDDTKKGTKDKETSEKDNDKKKSKDESENASESDDKKKSEDNDKKTSDTDDEEKKSDDNNKKPKLENLNDKLDEYIETYASHSDVGVAIINNKTGRIYTSLTADSSYVAWGWYLPVYLAYCNRGSYDQGIANGIMSSDAATCNNSANTAIRTFGGPTDITNYIKSNFSTNETRYGRYFGDVNAVSDNYTTPTEAVSFLKQLNKRGEATMLSYDLSSFGISTPSDTVVYAQAGTENRNVRNQLNLFAIVKSKNADYSVAIMTKNNEGSHISGLLAFINNEMDLRANE